MPFPAFLLLAATLLPLASFGVLLFIGKRMAAPIAGWFGTIMLAGSFGCSLGAMMAWLARGQSSDGTPWGYGLQPIHLSMKWIPFGPGILQDHAGWLDVGLFIDSVTIVMFAMISGIAALVHIFSIGYMREDSRFARFFTYLGLFCFSMMGLVLSSSLLQLFIFWELVGLCSYLLIGFWYERKSASRAAIKAFIMNRIGDFGFLIGFGILIYHVGNASLPALWQLLGHAGDGHPVLLPNGAVYGTTLLSITGIGLFFGAIGKSAQFPLQTWLADAMEGPTPVSALIHAATMVAAGVYLVARIFPILTPDAKLFIAMIGCITLAMGALIATVQSDIKKVLAYSTISQLGYMMLAIGIGSWVGGLFHLITHAFFKALLFLAAGSVIHAADHEQEMSQYGGLMWRIPVTAVTFFLAVLSISGFAIGGWGFAGYYSKELILQHAAAFGFRASESSPFSLYWLLFFVPAAVAYLTPFYMMRCWTLTFWGTPRNAELNEDARESPIFWAPLIVLAIASIIGGKVLLVREFIENARTEIVKLEQFDVFATAWPTAEARSNDGEENTTHGEGALGEGGSIAGTAPPKAAVKEVRNAGAATTDELLAAGEHRMHATLAGGFVWLIGIAAAFLMYMNGPRVAAAVLRAPGMKALHAWLYHAMCFDELYDALFVGVVIGFSRFASAFDRHVIDRFVDLCASVTRSVSTLAGLNDRVVVDGAVDGVALLAQDLGSAARAPQTGRIRLYVTILAIVITLALAGVVVTSLV